jgi:sucrose-6-phosphate hydrolase SacC (GH32 family)
LPNEHKVQFHTSPDLKTWWYLSDFGPAGDTNGIWECPEKAIGNKFRPDDPLEPV